MRRGFEQICLITMITLGAVILLLLAWIAPISNHTQFSLLHVPRRVDLNTVAAITPIAPTAEFLNKLKEEQPKHIVLIVQDSISATPSFIEKIKTEFPKSTVSSFTVDTTLNKEFTQIVAQKFIDQQKPQTLLIGLVPPAQNEFPSVEALHTATTTTAFQHLNTETYSTLNVICWQCAYIVSSYAKSFESHGTITTDNQILYQRNPDHTTKSPKATLIFTGDTMLGRTVEELMKKHGDDYPFQKITSVFKGVDLVVTNLEGPIVSEHKQTPPGSVSFSFDPKVAITMKNAGIGMATLGNNHGHDQGDEGYQETKKFLSNQNILTTGNAVKINLEDNLLETTVQNQVVRFYSFNVTFPFIDTNQAIELVKNNATNNQQDIVLIHWGIEYKESNSVDQQKLAHELINAGADLIIGHHPHVVQNIERYNNKFIFYSLGNFIFDQYFSKNTQESLIVGIILSENTMSLHLIPANIIQSQPSIMPIDEQRIFLEKIAEKTNDESLKMQIKNGYIE